MNPRELRNSNHNFPHLRIRLEIFVGLHRLRERECLGNLRVEPSIRQPVVHIPLVVFYLLQSMVVIRIVVVLPPIRNPSGTDHAVAVIPLIRHPLYVVRVFLGYMLIMRQLKIYKDNIKLK